MGTAGRLWSGEPRRRLVAAGVVAVVLHVLVTTLALAGLSRVQEVHLAVQALNTAQRNWQEADMAHDAVEADAGTLLLHVLRAVPAPQSRAELQATIADFGRELDQVARVDLPADLDLQVRAVRPEQDRYVDSAERLLAAPDAQAAVQAYGDVVALAAELVQEQDDVTEAIDSRADDVRAEARQDERLVQLQLLVSAVGALFALVFITVLLSRMGRDLSSLLARERGVAETLQHSLLPDRLPELPGVHLAARYAPGAVGSQVGGDWYDVVPLPGGRVGLVMGDVVGHDLRAAANMGQLRNALRACAADGAAPADVLHRLNRLCVSQDLGDMASVLYAVLDPVEGVVEIANAGHPPPLLVTEDGSCYLEAAPSPPVGVVREAAFRSRTWAVPPGALLLLYTDGLVERREVSLEPRLERLCEVVTAGRSTDLERLCDDVLAAMRGSEPADDDLALLLVAPQATLGSAVEVTWPASAERLVLLRHLLERWLAEVGAQEDEVYDVLVACSEAATNAIEHAYGPANADFRVTCTAEDGGVTVVVRDWGQWREPRGRDRGRGLGLMEGLMDDVQVSHSTSGTEVRLHRRLQQPLHGVQPVTGAQRELASP